MGGPRWLSQASSTGVIGRGQPVVLRWWFGGGTTMEEEREIKGRGEMRERAVGRERGQQKGSQDSPRMVLKAKLRWVPRKNAVYALKLTCRVPNFRKREVRLPNSKRGK